MISIQQQDFDMAVEYAWLLEQATNAGAVVTFVGRVRDYGDHSDVQSIWLEHYPGMTEKSLQRLVEQARLQWPLQAVRIVHRVGELGAGEQIVFVGVATSHRADAFSACEFLMDFLKTKAPFWKKEKSASGECWVEQKKSDVARAERWRS